MRLLRRSPTRDLELITFSEDDVPPYAVLSHTWTPGQEVTYSELVGGTGKGKAGYDKLHFCVDRATEDGIEYSWVDTCCIDKSTSDEVNTAINSMFRWYQRATKCYVYLSDVEVADFDGQSSQTTWKEAFRRSRWFTRGWTLQELLAPPTVEFFSKDGKRLGSRLSLEADIHEITKISINVLRGQKLAELSVDERMKWVAKRKTTVKEDKAYCLLGIFGVFMPLIYGEGEDHAYQRLREEIEKPSMRTETKGNNHTVIPQPGLEPTSNVPFRRDNDFVDRGDILKRIDELCSRPAGRAALVGFGGFGKSQLAIEYAHRIRQRSPDTWVFWIHASNSARLESAFSDIAEEVGLPPQATALGTIHLVRKWLCNKANGNWLIIVDNADTEVTVKMEKEEEMMSLRALLPESDHGAILVTSRNTDIARSLVSREKDIIAIGAMNENEAIQLLKNKLVDSPDAGAIQLVDALDHIPLALAQAAAYINRLRPRMSVLKYLVELKTVKKQAQLLSKTAPDARRDEQASNSVLTTWQISFDHISQKRPSAADLLSFMSFFNRQGIPEFMLRHYSDKEEKEQEGSTETSSVEEKKDVEEETQKEAEEEDETDFEEDVAVLRSFSLITTAQRESEFEMHGLVQLATRTWLASTDMEKKWHQACIRAMSAEFPLGNYEHWPKCQLLFPHVLSILEQEGSAIEKSGDLALLLYHAGWYAYQQGLFGQAEEMIREASEMQKDLFGPETQYTMASTNDLALVLNSKGKYDEAEQLYRQLVVHREKMYGLEHQHTLVSMGNLAIVLYNQGKYEEAEPINRQTLPRREKLFGREHPDTLKTMNNLAAVLSAQGKHEEAETMHRETLARREKVRGLDHPDTLMSMNNLAATLDNQGKHDEAVPIHRQALAQREKLLGIDHPDTLMSMSNLAAALDNQGKYKEAEPIHRKALARREKVLGSEHPDTMLSMSNLAAGLDFQGKHEEAEPLYRTALARRESVLGPEHPETLSTVYCGARVLANLDRYSEAVALYERACDGFTTALGKDHWMTRECRDSYSRLVRSHERGQQQAATPPAVSKNEVSVPKAKRSVLLRGLSKLGIQSSRFSKK